jgi:hypothetical protein
LGDTRGVGGVLNDLGNLADYQGAYGRAMALYQEALELHQGLGHRWGATITLGNMGSVAHKQGDYARARALHLESMAEFRAMGDKRGMITALTWLALALGGAGQLVEGARLAGAADVLREALNAPLMPGDRLTYDPEIAAMRTRLGEAAFHSAWASGRALDLETALDEAAAL